jgi:hypothetical protein
MTTATIRHRLISYLADADDNKIKAIYILLEKEIEEKGSFALTDEQLEIPDLEKELHLSGKSKSYSRVEAFHQQKPNEKV